MSGFKFDPYEFYFDSINSNKIHATDGYLETGDQITIISPISKSLINSTSTYYTSISNPHSFGLHTTEADALAGTNNILFIDNGDDLSGTDLSTVTAITKRADISSIEGSVVNTTSAHNYNSGDRAHFLGDVGTTGLSLSTTYFVNKVSDLKLTLHATQADALASSDATDVTFDTSFNNIGIGTSTPDVTLHVAKNDAIKIPVGTTLQRLNC